MSTKIYNGVVCKSNSMEEILQRISTVKLLLAIITF